jgi:glucan biosynthesis protein C
MQASKLERRYDIDVLRVIAVLILVPYHTARIFDVWEPFYAKSAQVSKALTYIFVGAVNPWHMPLFFLLAGASTWFALSYRSKGQYVQERVQRLIVPLVFGLLILIPPQSYIGALTYGNFDGSFWAYYPNFFQIGPSGDLTGYMGGFTPAHLWFILFLFGLALIALPLLLYLRGEAGRRLMGRAAGFLTKPGALFLLAIPVLLALLLPDIGGKNPFYYLVFFLYGYLLVAEPRLEAAVDRHKTPALILGLALLLIRIVVWGFDLPVAGWLSEGLGISLWGVAPWLLLIAILGFGRRYLNVTNPLLKYTSQAAYPFYLLHQTVIVIIGFYVVQWPIGLLPRFLIIVLAAIAATLLIYELLVKRSNVTRVLFGMKPRRKKVAARRVAEQKA